MINDQLLDQLNNLLCTLVKSQEASTDFRPRRILWSIFERSSEGRSIEEEASLSHLESDSQAVNYLMSALSVIRLTTWGWMVASRGSFSMGKRGRSDSGRESLTRISFDYGIRLTSLEFSIKGRDGRVRYRCSLCLLPVSSSLNSGDWLTISMTRSINSMT
jgi:hypothetical protein